MTVKINKLEIENVKRVTALEMEPTKNGLTIIGGKNRQGKTSVLDSIAWALGGDRFRPSNPQRADSVIPPSLKVTLSNGIIVERKGKNSELKVTDPSGQKAGQALLNSFVEALALDLPKFMTMSNSEKARVMLQTIGVADRLAELDKEEKSIYNERLYIGREADQKRKYANELPFIENMPEEPISAIDLIQAQQAILLKNAENAKKRSNLDEILRQREEYIKDVQYYAEQLRKAEEALALAEESVVIAQKSVAQLQDESTAELEEQIQNIEAINTNVRTNTEKRLAEKEATEKSNEYAAKTHELEEVRKQKIELLNGAKLPLPGLSVEDGELTYNGDKWDCLSGSDQLVIAASIVRAINPKCGFVLMDKLEQFDPEQLEKFGRWLEQEQLQVIATRVSTGGECSIIIEDGEAIINKTVEQKENQNTNWIEGSF